MNALRRAPAVWLALLLIAMVTACAPATATTSPTAGRSPATSPPSAATMVAGEPPAGRSDYRTSQPGEMPGYAQFVEDYETARSERAEWLRDPVEVALRAAGYATGSPDGLLPDQVTLYQTAPEQVSVVLLLEGAEDDSVRDVENRIDLAAEEGLWRVEWAGARWRCQAGRGQQDWGTELCI